jgi:small subunit ribosomal protein S8
MVTDTIADLLTRIRNGHQAGHRFVTVPASKVKLGIVKVLFEQGYVSAYKFEEDGPQGTIKIALKYDPITRQPAIQDLQRISRPGLRQYSPVKTMPRSMNGLGIIIVSTSRGIITDKEARKLNAGGELLCYVQ